MREQEGRRGETIMGGWEGEESRGIGGRRNETGREKRGEQEGGMKQGKMRAGGRVRGKGHPSFNKKQGRCLNLQRVHNTLCVSS